MRHFAAYNYKLNKNPWGVKKCEAHQKQHCKQAGMPKRFDTMKVLFVSKRVNWCQGDGFRAWVHEWVALNSQWLVLRIGGADFLHSWAANSIWLECAELLITK